MTIEDIISSGECKAIVDDYRAMCLWSMDEDFSPKNARQLALVAENLERYGDMSAYRKAGRIREWLSHRSSPAY